jgi:hypothetical protein
MGLGNLLDGQAVGDLYQITLSKGDIFLGKFDGINHEKFFVVAGLSQDKVYVCSVYINSNIPDFIFRKQELLNLQVPVKGTKYSFLKHDSFVSCNTQLKLVFSDIYNMIENKKCRYIGKLDMEDLDNIQTTLINSGLLTAKEIELYFHT